MEKSSFTTLVAPADPHRLHWDKYWVRPRFDRDAIDSVSNHAPPRSAIPPMSDVTDLPIPLPTLR